MEQTATVVGTATVSLIASASSTATSTVPVSASGVVEIVSTAINFLLLLAAVVGGLFAYWRYRIAAIDRLITVMDTESYPIKLWNLSQVIRGGHNTQHVFYDPGSSWLSPRAWDAVLEEDGWRVMSPNLQRTGRTWDEPYHSLFAYGFGPGHSADGARADFSRLSWLLRQIAVACGCGSGSPLERILRPYLVRYLLRVTGNQLQDTMLHFEVVVSRLVRFFDEGDDYLKADRDYFWTAYGFDTSLYADLREEICPEAGSRQDVYRWVTAARSGSGFQRVEKRQFAVWSLRFAQLRKERDDIPML